MKKLNTIFLCMGLVIFLSQNATGQPQPYLKNTGGTLTGALNGTTATFSGNVTGGSFIKAGGTSSQILAANGSVITAGSGITISGGTIHFTASSISSLNGLTGSTQTFATGTTGTDFTIASAGTTHTFNIPSASGTNRGLLTSADWTAFNAKQATITLTTTGSSGAATFSGNILNIPNYGGGWSLTGNSGTVDRTNSIGTTDDVPLSFLVDNTLSGRIEADFFTANTFLGFASGINNFGAQSAAVGFKALFNNTSGGQNTASGDEALVNNTTGGGNTADGFQALFNNNTGTNITAIGSAVDVNADGYDNSTAIGSGARIDGSNVVILGNTSITAIKANVTSLTSLSDRRFKKNIKEDVPGLEFIKLLKPVTYNYDIRSFNSHRAPDMTAMKSSNVLQASKLSKEDEAAITKKEKIVYSGLVAQDVEAAANKIGYDFSGLYKPQNDKDAYGLGYADFVVPLIKATQELSASNDSLKSQVTELQNQLNEIKAQLASMNKGGVSASSAIISSAHLEQNIPNPFNQTTQINYSVPQTAGSAMIVVTGMKGEKIRTVSLNAKGNGQLTLQTAQLVAGTYSYSLYVDGNLIDTKKMILVK